MPSLQKPPVEKRWLRGQCITLTIWSRENQECVKSGKPSFLQTAYVIICSCCQWTWFVGSFFLLRREGEEVEYDRLTETTNKVGNTPSTLFLRSSLTEWSGGGWCGRWGEGCAEHDGRPGSRHCCHPWQREVHIILNEILIWQWTLDNKQFFWGRIESVLLFSSGSRPS